MPVRNMLYDALQYALQVDELSRSHKSEKRKPETSAEFLSGLYKTDSLLPIVTLTMYFGADEWAAPRSLHEMFSANNGINKEILKFVEDYRIHLIAPADIADSDFDKFHTELSLALKFVKYSKDKERLLDMVKNDDAYKKVSKRTADMVGTVTNSHLRFRRGKETVDMCEAIEGIRNDGIAIGLARGRAEGKAEGKLEGRAEAILELLAGLVKDGILNTSEAAVRAGMSVSEFEEKMEHYS